MNASFSEIYRQVNAGNADNADNESDTSNDAGSEEQQRPARPRMALIVVDAQNDLSAGGALAVDGAEAAYTATYLHVAGTANKYSVLATTRDNHIAPGTHFSETPGLRRYLAETLCRRYPGCGNSPRHAARYCVF